jgi:hypothetical protein
MCVLRLPTGICCSWLGMLLLILQVSGTLLLCDSLLDLQRAAAASGAALSGATNKLLAERDALTEFSDALRARLSMFDEYESAASRFAAASSTPDGGPELLPLLRQLDTCLAYVSANPQYADAGAYTAKLRALQARSLALARTRAASTLRAAAAAVATAAAEAAANAGGMSAAAAARTASSSAAVSGVLSTTAAMPEGSEVSLLYVRFRAAAEPSLHGACAHCAAQHRHRMPWPGSLIPPSWHGMAQSHPPQLAPLPLLPLITTQSC